MKNILVIGKNGQVAKCLSEVAPAWGAITHLGRPEIDLLRTNHLADAVARQEPDIVINAAAYTAVDKAEGEPDTARTINAIAAGEIAKGAKLSGAPIIHVSTDYVFDGTETTPYNEADQTAPLGVYGRTKLEGEQCVAEAHDAHVIVRTAWVYSAYGSNFVKSMLRLGAERERLTIVSDQVGCPTSAHDLAAVLVQLAHHLTSSAKPDDYGLLHVCGTGIASWYDFARAIFRHDKRANPTVVPIKTADYPTPAKRPANSRLDMTRLEQHFGLAMPDWNTGLKNVITRLGTER
ncbi:MAG: dTDP-4-dehydrorhamnose reductase [Pseudomonadota bacterium]